VPEIRVGTTENIVMAVLSLFPQSIQPAIGSSNMRADKTLSKTGSSAAFGTLRGRSMRYPG
jgi:predicted oxidoreductase